MWSWKVQASLKKKSWIWGSVAWMWPSKAWQNAWQRLKAMPGCQNKTDDFLTLFEHPAEVMGSIGFCHIFRNIRDRNTFFNHLSTSYSQLAYFTVGGVDHRLLKDDFWCGQNCHGQRLRKEKQKTREEKKEGKKKEKKALIHSHRCVTPLLPQQKFTTELMTKGRAPMLPIVAWRTMWRLWKANPSALLTAWAFKQTRRAISPQGWVASDSGGKPRAAHHRWAFAQGADWDAIVRGRILSPLSGHGRLCSVRRWARRMPHRRAAEAVRELCERCCSWFCFFDIFFFHKINHFLSWHFCCFF